MKALSELELSLLKHLAARPGATSREVAEEFGKPNKYARTTVHTLLERLRSKGYVTREQAEGGFVYSSSLTQADLMRAVVSKFVNRTLGGSVSPLVSYLVEQGELDDHELDQLQSLIDQLKEAKP